MHDPETEREEPPATERERKVGERDSVRETETQRIPRQRDGGNQCV